MGQQQQQQRRKSSSSRYDFDEDFMRFVSLRCNLELEPEEILGRGSFGTVIQGRYHGENNYWILKAFLGPFPSQ